MMREKAEDSVERKEKSLGQKVRKDPAKAMVEVKTIEVDLIEVV